MMRISPVRTVAPLVEPVTLDDAKAHCRVDGAEEDTLIAALISAAVGMLDGWSGTLGRCLVTQTWRQDFDGFAGDVLRLPFPDVASVTVAYTDAAGAAQVLDAANYHLVNGDLGASILLADAGVWPSVAVVPNAVRITMVCGYGAADAVPAAIKAAILLHVAHLYRNREAVGDTQAVLPLSYDALIAPYRRAGC